MKQKTQKTFKTLEEMEAEILTLGISQADAIPQVVEGSEGDMSDILSSEISASGSDMSKIEENFEKQRATSEELDFVGLTEAEAEALAKENNVSFRVVMRDGAPLPVTMDYRPGRINAEVTDGVVSSFSVE